MQTSTTTLDQSSIMKFFDLSIDLISIANTEGSFLKINPAFSKILGFSEEELLNTPFINYVHPDDVDKTITEVERLSRGLKTIMFENRYRTRSGSYRWLAWTCMPDAETGLLYAIARDNTVNKQIETELLDTKTMLNDVVNNLNVGVVIANEKGEFVVFNEAAVRIVGIGMMKGGPEYWSDHFGIYYPGGKEKMFNDDLPLTKAMKGETIKDCKLRIINRERPEGVDIITDSKPLYNREGKLNGAVITITEIKL